MSLFSRASSKSCGICAHFLLHWHLPKFYKPHFWTILDHTCSTKIIALIQRGLGFNFRSGFSWKTHLCSFLDRYWLKKWSQRWKKRQSSLWEQRLVTMICWISSPCATKWFHCQNIVASFLTICGVAWMLLLPIWQSWLESLLVLASLLMLVVSSILPSILPALFRFWVLRR